MVHATMFGTLDGRESLIHKIVALHLVYSVSRPQIIWFSQLVSHHPGIMLQVETNMKSHPPEDMEMVRYHLYNYTVIVPYVCKGKL